MEMSRTMLMHAGAPKSLQGDSHTYATYILNRCPWKRGQTQTRIERYKQRKMQEPLKMARVFGCAVWVHQVHPTGPHVDKMSSRAAEHIFVGISVERQCYICRRVTDFKIVYSAHCTFNEAEFPCRKLAGYQSRSSDFYDDGRPHGLENAPLQVLPRRKERKARLASAAPSPATTRVSAASQVSGVQPVVPSVHLSAPDDFVIPSQV